MSPVEQALYNSLSRAAPGGVAWRVLQMILREHGCSSHESSVRSRVTKLMKFFPNMKVRIHGVGYQYMQLKPRSYSMRNERSARFLAEVHPDLQLLFNEVFKERQDFIITCGMRTEAEQAKLFKAGATKTMDSRHLTGHAVDIAMVIDNQVVWDWRYYQTFSTTVKAVAERLNIKIVWGGDWKSFRDGPHYELDRNEYPKEKR